MDWRFWVFDPLLKTNSPSAKVHIKALEKIGAEKKGFSKTLFW
jgi:hypothetical protein